MKKVLFFLVLIVAIIIIIFSAFSLIVISKMDSQGEGSLFKIIFKRGEDKHDSKDQETSDSETSGIEVKEGLLDSSSGDSGGSSDSGCLIRQISYSMINPNRTMICNEYQGETCINKTIDCSTEIHNRNSEVAGIFELKLIFLEEGENKENAIDTKISSFTLEPMNYEIFEEVISVQSIGEEGIANKNINCFFNTLQVPTKEVC